MNAPIVSNPTTPTDTPDRTGTAALILAAVEDHGLPYPHCVRMYDSDPIPLLSLDLDDSDGYRAWADYLDIPHDWHRREGVSHNELPLIMFNATALNWHGWRQVAISATDAMSAEQRAALDAESTPSAPMQPAPGCAKCGGEVVHQAGCPADPPTVSPEGIPEHLADHFAVLNPDVPIPYVPVAWPTGDAANADECARLMSTDFPGTPFGRGDTITIIPGVAAPLPHGPVDPRVHYVPTDLRARNGHEPHADHEPTDRDARIVDVVTVDLDLRDGGRGDPNMASLMRQPYAADQSSFAEAPDRLAGAELDVTAEMPVIDITDDRRIEQQVTLGSAHPGAASVVS